MNKFISWIAIGLGVIAIVLAVVGGNFYQPQLGSTTTRNEGGGTRFPNGISPGEGSLLVVNEVLEAGTNQSYWYNQTGKRQCAFLSTITTGDTASSSVTFNIGTSTSSSLDKDYDFGTTLLNGSLFNAAVINTSTPAHTIESFTEGLANQKVTCVDDGQYLLYIHRTTIETETENCSTNGGATRDYACDTATSTALNIWPVSWTTFFFATTTLDQ